MALEKQLSEYLSSACTKQQSEQQTERQDEQETERQDEQETERQDEQERGAILIFVVLLVVVLIALTGLVVDLARLQYTVIRAQQSADAAALAAVIHLDDPSDIDNWRKTKKAVLASLSQSQLYALDDDAAESLKAANSDYPMRTMRFLEGETTPHDYTWYAKHAGSAGNLGVEVVRGVFCYVQTSLVPPSFERRWYALERTNHYCKANSVQVDITVREVPTTFATIFGVREMNDVRVSAQAHLNPAPYTCGHELCDDLGIVGEISSPYEYPYAQFNPDPPC